VFLLVRLAAVEVAGEIMQPLMVLMVVQAVAPQPVIVLVEVLVVGTTPVVEEEEVEVGLPVLVTEVLVVVPVDPPVLPPLPTQVLPTQIWSGRVTDLILKS
jgi:hypothetical protein